MYTYEKDGNIGCGEDVDMRRKIRTPESMHTMQGQPHMHDFIVLSYMKAGECRQRIDGVEYLTKRGDLLFIGMNQTHQILLSGDVEQINIHLTGRLWSEELKNVDNFESIFALSIFNEFKDVSGTVSPMISFSGAEIPEVESILERMMTESEKREIGYRAPFRRLP